MLKSFENRDGWIWMNGKIVPWKNAKTHVISQGLHYASAVFEGKEHIMVKYLNQRNILKDFLNLQK